MNETRDRYWLDRLVEYFAPRAALRRAAARAALTHYDVAKRGRLRKSHSDRASPNDIVGSGAPAARAEARNLERNHDIARGILRSFVNNVAGSSGIGVEPQPRRADGTIHREYAKALADGWRDWCRNPEVTHRRTWAQTCRLEVRTWVRDGEGLAQMLYGRVPTLDHGTRVPFSLELIEPDLLPFDYDDAAKGIRQSIESNAWGRPRRYWLYRQHPGETTSLSQAYADMKWINAADMLHVAVIDRIGQGRGISEFASIAGRLSDLKDYEESERIAAKVAASLTAYVKRGSPDMYQPAPTTVDANGQPSAREVSMRPGTIIDTLQIGEEIGLIDSKRPNPGVLPFRQGQLRAVAAGAGASYSTIARDYDGTYSAQRQELVEQWINYATLADEFVGMFVQPIFEKFVWVADMAGVIPTPPDVMPGTADDALFIAQSMPWIDPVREALGWEALVKAGFASEVEVMRKRGVNPWDVLEQIDQFRKDTKSRGLVFTSDAANEQKAAGAGAANAQASSAPEPGRTRGSRSRAPS